MNAKAYPYGFRVLGELDAPRRLVNAGAAWAGHCTADPKAEPHRECYLSLFRFGDDLAEYLTTNGTEKGFTGPTWAEYLAFDIDRTGNLDGAAKDAARLGEFLAYRYPELDEPLIFFSGSKGFHVLLPLAHRPPGGPIFHCVCRRLAETLAGMHGVRIDQIYTGVRCFRAPNSRHPKTGLHKVRLSLEDVVMRDPVAFIEMAREPIPFDSPEIPNGCPQLALDWAEAERAVALELSAKPPRSTFDGRLQRETIELLRDGCPMGERALRLFRAAANLAEAGDAAAIIHAILDEIGADLGLPFGEVRRQVDSGIAHARRPAASPVAREGGSA